MAANLKNELFNQPEDEINFNSFRRFSLLAFRLALVDFQPLREGASAKERFIYTARNVYHIICAFGWCLALLSKIVLIFHHDNLMDASPTVLDVVTYFLNILKVIHTIARKKDIWILFEDLKPLFDRRTNDNRKYGVKKYLQQYNRVMVYYSAPLISFFGLNVLSIVPFILFGTMRLFLNYWYPFDPYQVNTFPFAYAWVLWAAYFSLTNMLATDATLYAIITILSMEFDILKSDLMNILKNLRDERSKKMNELVDHHNILMSLCDRLEAIYSVTFLFSFVISSLIMCFVVFQISQSNNFATIAFYFSYLGMMGGPIMMLCFYGQKLIDSSESVADGIYESEWETLEDNDIKKLLALIMLRAQRYKKLTAMKFFEVSLVSFKTVRSLQINTNLNRHSP